jgi:hypothetical protein
MEVILIEVVEKTDLEVTVFISNDEPFYKTSAIVLGFSQKGLTTYYSNVKTDVTFKEHIGRLITFVKQQYANKRETIEFIRFSNSKKINDVRYTKYTSIKNQEIIFDDLIESDFQSNITKLIYPRFGEYLKPETLDVHFKVTSTFHRQNQDDNENEINHIISRLITLEEQAFGYLLIPAAIHQMNTNNSALHQVIQLREISKINKYLSIFDSCGIPSKETKKKFIDLCQIIRDNKVIETLKMNMIILTKSNELGGNKTLTCKFLGFQLFREEKFKKFIYLDHPGINFIADFLDKADLLNTLEARISKEILTRI